MAFYFEQMSDKQQQLSYWWSPGSPYVDYDMVIADGAIRSGKTVAMTASFMRWSGSAFNGQHFIIAGRTMGSLKRNVLSPLIDILDGWGWDYKLDRGANILTVGTNTYHLFGASTEKSQDTLQGMTAAGAFADEVALFPQSFVDQMIGRCSVDGARLFLNCNPRGPFHWFKTEYIDKADEKRILYLHFNMDDNLTLSETVKARYRRMFSGVFYKRYILGEWVRAEGVIYDMFDEGKHVIDHSGPLTDYYVSIDYGTQNPCVFLLFGKTKDGTWVCAREYYWDGRTRGKQKTDEDYYRDLEEFVGDLPVRTVIVDPSAASFIATIRKHGRFSVKKGKNAVQLGIRRTATALSAGMIRFDRSCVQTVKEFHSYVWNEKAVERGEDEPLKENDHALDAVRYFVSTIVAGGQVSVLK